MTKKLKRDRLQPRKQPAQARAEATVSAILDSAARILETGGLPALTTNAVAERAGVSIGSLYQYFPNKDALTAALIHRETAVLLDEVHAASASITYAAGMRALVEAAVRHQLRRPELARVLDFEERRLPLDARERTVAKVIMGAVTRFLSLPDAPRTSDTVTAAADVLAIVKGMVDAAGERRETDERALVRRVLRAALGYFK